MKNVKLIITASFLIILGLAAFAEGAGREKRIMVFGDSNTFGYVEDARGKVDRLPSSIAWPGKMAGLLGAGYALIVEGLSGRTTNMDSPERSGTGIIPGAGMNGAAYLPAALSSHMPLDMVIIMLGTNDLRKDRNRTAEDIAGGIMQLVHIVQKGEWQQRTNFSIPKVLVICPPKLDLRNSRYKAAFEGSLAKSEALPEILRPLVEASGAIFFDAARIIPFAQGADEIHLTADNHAALAQAVAREVKKAFGNSDSIPRAKDN
ncbi:MAG: SGNH/GDSL hydrolase family protein [Mailhella sp.]|nr:SGNH/GDSL hydrolase family protein [Mailhella sp.]